MSVLANIIDALVAAVIATPVATDATSPGVFKHETKVPLKQSNYDRGFIVETGLPVVLNYINLPGKVTCQVKVIVHVSYVNEHRGETAAQLLVSQDAEHLNEYLFFAVRNASVVGLNSWTHDGEATVEGLLESTRRMLHIPFVAVYYDDAVTS